MWGGGAQWASAVWTGVSRSMLPVRRARLTSWIVCVTLMSRGQAEVQLKTVRHRQTPSASLRISSRSAAPRSRESKMKRWALMIAAGPTYFRSPQKGGQAVVQQAQRMHLVVSSYRARCEGDWSRSVVGAGSSLTRNVITDL